MQMSFFHIHSGIAQLTDTRFCLWNGRTAAIATIICCSEYLRAEKKYVNLNSIHTFSPWTMPPAYPTIATASQPRIRNGPHPKTAPQTAEQLKAKREAHAEKQAQIDGEVGDWFSATLKKAEE